MRQRTFTTHYGQSDDGVILHYCQPMMMESASDGGIPQGLVPFRIASHEEATFFVRKPTDSLAYSQDPFDPFAEPEASRDDDADEEEFPVILAEKRDLPDQSTSMYNIDEGKNSLLESMKTWEGAPMSLPATSITSLCCPLPSQKEEKENTTGELVQDAQITWQQSSFGYSVDETMFLASLSNTDVSTSQVRPRRKHRPANLLRDVQSTIAWAVQEVGKCVYEGFMAPCGERPQKQDKEPESDETPCTVLASKKEESFVSQIRRDLSHAANKAKSALLCRDQSTSSSFSEFSEVEWKSRQF